MSNPTQLIKAQQRREKFATLLRELFQLDQPELDFDLYRIMHARKDDINRIIEKDLPRTTQAAFSNFASQDKTQLEADLEKARKAAEDAGFNPDESPKVQALQNQLKGGFDLAREEGEVYDALVTFFNRYYSEGDFLSRRVYKDGTYAIKPEDPKIQLHKIIKDIEADLRTANIVNSDVELHAFLVSETHSSVLESDWKDEKGNPVTKNLLESWNILFREEDDNYMQKLVDKVAG